MLAMRSSVFLQFLFQYDPQIPNLRSVDLTILPPILYNKGIVFQHVGPCCKTGALRYVMGVGFEDIGDGRLRDARATGLCCAG